MNLPPVHPTPHVSRLLGPDEFVIYSAKLHPFHGVQWLLGAVGCAVLAYLVWWPLLLPGLVCLVVYILPFRNHEVAVTNRRLLIRQGRFRIHSYAVDADHLDHYRLHETPFSTLFHFGTVILGLRAIREIRPIKLETCWHPMTLLEALTTLNPMFGRKSGQAKDSAG